MADTSRKIPKLPAGQRVDWRHELGSTNRVAMDLAEAGEDPGLWLVADRQTSGRGRAKRSWISQPGNLFASYLTSFLAPAYELHGIPLVAGLALYDAVEALVDQAETAFPLALKWPNDLTLSDAKLGGILVETTSSPTPGSYPVIIGFGLNLQSAPQLADQATASLGSHLEADGIDVSCVRALECLGDRLEYWLGLWDGGDNMDVICAAWMERGTPLGSRLTVRGRGGAPIEGRFVGLDAQGALLLDRGFDILTVSFGDVDVLNRGDAGGDGKNGET